MCIDTIILVYTQMHPTLLQLGAVTIYTHGLMAVLGIILGAVVTYFLAAKKDLRNPYFFDLIVFSSLLGIIGARLAYFILYRDQFVSSSQLLFLWKGGLVSYGGFVVGGIAFALISRAQKQPVLRWLDFMSVGFFFGLMLGRIGDLFAGEYSGVAISGSKFLGYFSVVPVPLFELLLCLVIFILSLLALLRFNDRLRDGTVFLWSVAIYSMGRFVLDFWRTENDWFWQLSIGQVFSLILFMGALIAMILLRVKRKDIL